MTTPPADESTGNESITGRLVELVTSLAVQGVAIGAILYFYGFARTQSFYRHFGIDMSLLSMSTTDLMLRSLNILVAPLLLLSVTAAAVWLLMAAGHTANRKLHGAAGIVLIVGGVAGIVMLVISILRTNPDGDHLVPMPAAASITLFFGALTGWLFRLKSKGSTDISSERIANHGQNFRDRAIGGASRASLLVAVAFSLITLGSLAELNGRQAAGTTERGLPDASRITLHSDKDLGLPVKSAGHAAEDKYGFVYPDLRLLIHANGRYFLVQRDWTQGKPVFIIADDDHVRIDINTDLPSASTSQSQPPLSSSTDGRPGK